MEIRLEKHYKPTISNVSNTPPIRVCSSKVYVENSPDQTKYSAIKKTL